MPMATLVDGELSLGGTPRGHTDCNRNYQVRYRQDCMLGFPDPNIVPKTGQDNTEQTITAAESVYFVTVNS